jgi:hypothetical protein
MVWGRNLAWHGKGITFLLRRNSPVASTPSTSVLVAASVAPGILSSAGSGEHTPPTRAPLSTTASPATLSRRNLFEEVSSPSPPLGRPPSIRGGGVSTPVEGTLPRLIRSARLQAVLLQGASPSPGAQRKKGGIAFAGGGGDGWGGRGLGISSGCVGVWGGVGWGGGGVAFGGLGTHTALLSGKAFHRLLVAPQWCSRAPLCATHPLSA